MSFALNAWPHATICLTCGSWIEPGIESCRGCGTRSPHPEWQAFYELALRIETQTEGSGSTRLRFQRAGREPLAHGASTEILAVISAYLVGLLTNASYDVIKAWLLSKPKREEASALIERAFHYSIVVEIIDSHVRAHPEIAEAVQDTDLEPPAPVVSQISQIENELVTSSQVSQGESNE